MTKTWIGTSDLSLGHHAYDFIVMHWGVVSSIAQIDKEVLSPARSMSYHYAIEKDIVHQYVDEKNTAWHANNFNINQRSIGICITAGPSHPYCDEDYETAAQLIAEIIRRHGPMKITAHRDYTPTQCPGNFDFERLNKRVNDILNPAIVTASVQNAPQAPQTQELPPQAPKYQINSNLYPGLVNNEEVKKLQDFLKSILYFPADMASTGNYGTITKSAIAHLQVDNKIVDSLTAYGAGYCGPKTRDLINKYERTENAKII